MILIYHIFHKMENFWGLFYCLMVYPVMHRQATFGWPRNCVICDNSKQNPIFPLDVRMSKFSKKRPCNCILLQILNKSDTPTGNLTNKSKLPVSRLNTPFHNDFTFMYIVNSLSIVFLYDKTSDNTDS